MRWQHAAEYWDRVGADNPFGIILTGADRSPRYWDVDRFFETGVADTRWLIARLDGIAPHLPRRAALDFGCGVGRITRPLSDHFERVVGVDVARSMVVRARRLNSGFTRCEFRINRSRKLRGIPSDSFDLVYSRLVLQHIPPRNALRYVTELVRVLAPNGVLVFQLPEPLEFDPDSLFSAEASAFVHAPVSDTRLKRLFPRWLIQGYRHVRFRRLVHRASCLQRMYVFGVPRTEVVDLLAGTGAKILRIETDQSHGDDVAGWMYWVTK